MFREVQEGTTETDRQHSSDGPTSISQREVTLLLNNEAAILRANSHAYELLGFGEKELTGKPLEASIHPKDAQLWNDLLAAMRTSGAAEQKTMRIRSSRDRWIPASFRGYHLGSPADGQYFLIIDPAGDPSGQPLLSESEDRYRKLLSDIPSGVILHDEKHIIHINRSGLSILASKMRSEVNGRAIWDFVHPDHRLRFCRLIEIFFRGEAEHLSLRQNLFCCNGDIIEADLVFVAVTHQKRRAVQIIFYDLTNRRRAAEQNQVLTRAIHCVEECVVISDLDDHILFVNRAFEKIYGYGEKELLGKPNIILHAPNNPIELDNIPAQTMAHGSWNGEVINRRKDSTEFPVSLSTGLVKNESGKPIAMISVASDLTGQQARESELQHTRDQLRQIQKLEALGRLAGGIAHDFNNLLTVIRGHCQLVLLQRDQDEVYKQELAPILESATRATDLTRQLLAFSRRQVLKPSPLQMAKVINDMSKLLERLIGEDVQLHTRLSETPGVILADRSQIEQIIMNLSINARDAMPDGGDLIIEASELWLEQLPNHPKVAFTPGDYVLLTVSDTGTGIAPEHQAQIFEPFFTTKDPGQGTGLGLSTVYGIVKQSGGYIWVYSEEGIGTTFKIYLPKSSQSPPLAELPPVVSEELHGDETILLVEDEKSVRTIVEKTLKLYGYNVLSTASATEAITVYEQRQGDGIDLMLTDVVMPEISGVELVKQIHSVAPSLAVVYMSGYTEKTIARHGILSPGVNFLQKPFSPETLLSKIREALSKTEPS